MLVVVGMVLLIAGENELDVVSFALEYTVLQ